MRIAVFGTGGVGGYFGGVLAHAGHDVTFIARGNHLEAMQNKGLKVESPYGDFSLFPVKATDSPDEVGEVEYVLVAVKHYHLDEAAPALEPMVGEGTTVVPLLNGVDAHEKLIHRLGEEPVVGGLCSLVSMVAAPGVIRHISKLRRVVVGELDRSKSARVERLIGAWKAYGIEAIHADDIYIALWTKFLFIASLGGVSSLARANAGEIRRCAKTYKLLEGAMLEVEGLARHQGIALAEEAVPAAMALVEGLEPNATSSMQRDVEAGGQFELEAFSGTIVRLGGKFGIATPIHSAIYALLEPALERAQAKTQ